MRNAIRSSCLFAAITIMFLLPSAAPAQQKCNQKGVIQQDTDVYKQLPRFVTGSGWQGERVARLSKNTQVYICGEQSAAFGFSTKSWVQIAYAGANNAWQYGWVLKDSTTGLNSSLRGTDAIGGYSLIAVALAADPSAGGKDRPAWTLGPPPPVPAPQSEDKSASLAREPSSASLSDLGELYWPLFIAMLFGMLAKAGVDWLDSSDKVLVKQHIRNAFVAILVSPIVFLGFLSAGQFSASTQTFVVLCLLAFQNGFFWQTVLKRNVRDIQANAAANTAGTP